MLNKIFKRRQMEKDMNVNNYGDTSSDASSSSFSESPLPSHRFRQNSQPNINNDDLFSHQHNHSHAHKQFIDVQNIVKNEHIPGFTLSSKDQEIIHQRSKSHGELVPQILRKEEIGLDRNSRRASQPNIKPKELSNRRFNRPLYEGILKTSQSTRDVSIGQDNKNTKHFSFLLHNFKRNGRRSSQDVPVSGGAKKLDSNLRHFFTKKTTSEINLIGDRTVSNNDIYNNKIDYDEKGRPIIKSSALSKQYLNYDILNDDNSETLTKDTKTKNNLLRLKSNSQRSLYQPSLKSNYPNSNDPPIRAKSISNFPVAPPRTRRRASSQNMSAISEHDFVLQLPDNFPCLNINVNDFGNIDSRINKNDGNARSLYSSRESLCSNPNSIDTIDEDESREKVDGYETTLQNNDDSYDKKGYGGNVKESQLKLDFIEQVSHSESFSSDIIIPSSNNSPVISNIQFSGYMPVHPENLNVRDNINKRSSLVIEPRQSIIRPNNLNLITNNNIDIQMSHNIDSSVNSKFQTDNNTEKKLESPKNQFNFAKFSADFLKNIFKLNSPKRNEKTPTTNINYNLETTSVDGAFLRTEQNNYDLNDNINNKLEKQFNVKKEMNSSLNFKQSLADIFNKETEKEKENYNARHLIPSSKTSVTLNSNIENEIIFKDDRLHFDSLNDNYHKINNREVSDEEIINKLEATTKFTREDCIANKIYLISDDSKRNNITKEKINEPYSVTNRNDVILENKIVENNNYPDRDSYTNGDIAMGQSLRDNQTIKHLESAATLLADTSPITARKTCPDKLSSLNDKDRRLEYRPTFSNRPGNLGVDAPLNIPYSNETIGESKNTEHRFINKCTSLVQNKCNDLVESGDKEDNYRQTNYHLKGNKDNNYLVTTCCDEIANNLEYINDKSEDIEVLNESSNKNKKSNYNLLQSLKHNDKIAYNNNNILNREIDTKTLNKNSSMSDRCLDDSEVSIKPVEYNNAASSVNIECKEQSNVDIKNASSRLITPENSFFKTSSQITNYLSNELTTKVNDEAIIKDSNAVYNRAINFNIENNELRSASAFISDVSSKANSNRLKDVDSCTKDFAGSIYTKFQLNSDQSPMGDVGANRQTIPSLRDPIKRQIRNEGERPNGDQIIASDNTRLDYCQESSEQNLVNLKVDLKKKKVPTATLR